MTAPARSIGPLTYGARIGVLGGGQLGRMLALAGARLGFDVHIFDPDSDAPARRVAAGGVAAQFDDLDAVTAFAHGCAAVTYEFENVPSATAAAAAKAAPLRPGAKALDAAQDRLAEKAFARSCGAQTAAHAAVHTQDDILAALGHIGTPGLLKTRRLGYDGKGQAWVHQPEDAAAAWQTIGAQPAVLEAKVAFSREVSLIAARSLTGAIAAYPLIENVHEDGILRTSSVPASVSPALETEARRVAAAMLEALDYVGVIAVEFFVVGERLLVNEFAPRVHNSGHWSEAAAVCDQFEQHMRAVAGWPLGSSALRAPAVMENLVGPEGLERGLACLANEPAARVHLYAKRQARPGRKVGHITRLAPAETGMHAPAIQTGDMHAD